jgi:hypothetical protein
MREVLSLATFVLGMLCFVAFVTAVKPNAFAQPRRRTSLPIAKRMTRRGGDAVCTSLPQHQASGSGGDGRQRVDGH